MVGLAYHIEVMLYDNDRVAPVNELLQHSHQYAYVLEMQPCGRLIEYVYGLASVPFAQFGGQFHTLTLASGKRG